MDEAAEQGDEADEAWSTSEFRSLPRPLAATKPTALGGS